MKYRPAIILEGPDCSGKSTLAKKIAEHYNNDTEYNIVHNTGHDPNDYDFYYQLMRKTNVIYDRLFIGETIYPKIFNRAQKLNVEEFDRLVSVAKNLHIPIIVVVPSNEILITRLKNERPNEETEIVNTITYARDLFYKRAKSNDYIILIEPKDGQIDYNDVFKKIDEVFQGGFYAK